MLQTIRNAWKVQEIRNKILFTIFALLIFRVGSAIPVPFIDTKMLSDYMSAQSASIFGLLNVMSGDAFAQATVFALSIQPYINASIIMQLLTYALPPLERMRDEGEEGRKKIAQLTRYAAVILGLIQGIAYFFYLKNSGHLVSGIKGGAAWFAGAVIITAFTAGSALVMWLGEQIDVKGIGNGISMILFAGIISRGPDAFAALWSHATNKENPQPIPAIAIVLIFLVVIAFIVWMTRAERRVPVQYAKRVVGRKQYGGQNSHIPFKVNMSGVMPIIFASSILMLPTMVLSFMDLTKENTWAKIFALFSTQGVFYAVLYFFMIIGFAYFYAQIQYNPVEIANNIRKNGGSVPGIRPGKPTSDFFAKILSRITLLGALFLSVIAILPIFVGNIGGLNISIGGTSVLIMVGVALDTVQNLESQMMMRHYKGFLD